MFVEVSIARFCSHYVTYPYDANENDDKNDDDKNTSNYRWYNTEYNNVSTFIGATCMYGA